MEQVPGTNISFGSPVALLVEPDDIDLRNLLQSALINSDDTGDNDGSEPDLSAISQLEPAGCSTSVLGHRSGSPCEVEPPPKKQKYANRKRSHKRHADIIANGHRISAKIQTQIIERSMGIQTELAPQTLPSTKPAYTALNGQYPDASKPYTLSEIRDMGFTVQKWDGITPTVLANRDQRVFAVLAGRPNSDEFLRSADSAAHAILQEGQTAEFTVNECNHRRGQFPAIGFGVSYGNGQTCPAVLRQKPHHLPMLHRLTQNPDICRLAHFASASFAQWAPRLYDYYRTNLDVLYLNQPELARNFPRSVFPAATMNFGPNTWCFKHRDSRNCAFGWCAIQALGAYDPTKGGHLILWDLRMAIEFPPGSCIHIPSAILTHSNIPVGNMETRLSFTQYCAGELFHWVDNGFRTEKALKDEDPEEWRRLNSLKEQRLEEALARFSTLGELGISAL